MPLIAGTRLGSYEIIAPLGAGGMGEVYRARDTRLNRVVAIKALHSLLGADPERAVRFDREAQLLASLNHPNIGAIHGLEHQGSEKYLVLEFVEGRTLSDVLKSGALPVQEAIAFARQIADALAAAHERGIIHRDIKPGNIMVTPEGVIKVLDFGLGKVLDSEPASETSNSPTMTMAATQQGLILGTAGYMSPEQAKGRAADKRSDVWAFGGVLYEMLTGKRAFEGEDITETLAAIVRGEPDWAALPAGTPPGVREIVERCLVKNRAERMADMSVVRYLLSDRALRAAAPPTAAATSTAPRGAIGWPLAAGLILAAALVTAIGMGLLAPSATPAPAAGVTRLTIPLPEGLQLALVNQAPLAISPDGSTIAFAGARGSATQLFVRSLSESEPKALAGTEGAKSPFFSPDGKWIGFFTLSKLKKIATTGSGLQVIADAPEARGGWWTTDDNIYFAPTNTSGIWRVPASAGTATELTHPDKSKGEISHVWPQVLPDHQTILFGVRRGPGPDEHEIVSQSLATGERHPLIQGGDFPRSTTTGHLVYGRFDTLIAAPWTPSTTTLAGVVPLTLPELSRLENEAASALAFSDNGTLVYLAGGPSRTRNRLLWVDHSGKTEALRVPEREYENVAISPDGRQAVVQILEGTITLWMVDLERQTMTPFLVTGGSSQAPVWTADGTHIIYRATRNGTRNIFWKSADGTGVEERLTTKDGVVQTPMSVSPDGKCLLFGEGGIAASTGTWILPLPGAAGAGAAADRAPRSYVTREEAGGNGQFSPDGRWIAYTSAVSGQSEVYVRPFPGPGPRKQITTMGADEPRWSRDGRELYFTDNNQRVMAATVDNSSGSTFSAGVPHVLHEGHYKEQVNANTAYDVSKSGRFLMVQQGQTQNAVTRIEVVLNWFSELRVK